MKFIVDAKLAQEILSELENKDDKEGFVEGALRDYPKSGEKTSD
jgi:hypothetical protein